MGALFLIERESVGKNEGCALLDEGQETALMAMGTETVFIQDGH